MLEQQQLKARGTGYVADLPDFPSFDPATAETTVDALLGACRASIERHLGEREVPGWSLVAEETECNDAFERYWSVLSHLHAVADNEALRAAYNNCLAAITRHYNWRQHHEGLCAAYRRLRDSADFETLRADQKRLIDLELRDFHLAGVDLPEAQKVEYREIVERLSDLGARFGQNLLDAGHAWHLHVEAEDRLSGLPAPELNLLAGLARAKGMDGWLIDLGYPAYSAIMTHARDRELRREVYMAHATRASERGPHAGRWDNTPLVAEFLSLRHRLAKVLGYEQYVELALETRMAESREEVEAFLVALAARARPAARAQLEEITRLAEREGAPTPLAAWDIAFWSERLRHTELDLSDEVLKPYFSLEGMLDALKEMISRLFGLRLALDPGVRAWHDGVRFFWLEDHAGSRFGGFYLDPYVRKAKRDGAWMGICRSRRMGRGGVQMPIAYLNCNFPPPVQEQPSLLAHEDVRTLFHEAGHCLHHLLTRIDWPQINGTNNIEWDAVELPSQLFEYWAWEEELLARFACHYRSGEPMPSGLRDRMRRSRHFLKALSLVRQIEFAMVDLRLHSEYDPSSPPDPLRVMEEVRAQFGVVPVPPENRFLNSFSHIFGGGYSAGYYSYLWAEELAADAWDRFREAGAFDAASGAALRDEILAVGASRPAIESFIAFRGRKPEPGPLLKTYGLG